MTAMAEQGYLLADAQHAPTQLLVFAWGLSEGIAPEFLGADTRITHLGAWHPPGVWAKVWDFAESELFLGLVRSFTLDSETAPKVTMLWETRFACPATGLAMGDAMPLMIQAAALNFGRETKVPLNINVSDESKGRVDFGELKVMGSEPPKDKPAPADAR
jgi:hypothetical protein